LPHLCGPPRRISRNGGNLFRPDIPEKPSAFADYFAVSCTIDLSPDTAHDHRAAMDRFYGHNRRIRLQASEQAAEQAEKQRPCAKKFPSQICTIHCANFLQFSG
jgi:hypothetical protein